MSRPRDREATRIAGLDGLRGIAILLVILYHGVSNRSLLTAAPIDRAIGAIAGAGWMGVDLFFVISGFLITGILSDSRNSANYFRSFYFRRTLRIFPLYYAALLLVLVLVPLAVPSFIRHPGRLASGNIWFWTYLTNWYIAWTSAPGAFPHFWSLAVEEQFYLIWPLIVLLTSPRNLFRLCLTIVVGTPFLRFLLLRLGTDPLAVFVLTPTRIDALAIGAALACVARDPTLRVLSDRGVRNLGIAGAVGLVGTALLAGTTSQFTLPMQVFGFSIIALASATLVYRAEALPFVRSRWLTHIGERSYGLYVWHPLALVAVHRAGLARWIPEIGGSGLARQAALWVLEFCLSMAVAEMSWHLWERHWLALKRYAPRLDKPQSITALNAPDRALTAP